MKLKISNISEREIRRYIQGYIDLQKDYEFIIELVNKLYEGKFTNLLYSLVDGESDIFRKVDESMMIEENFNIEKVANFLNLKELLDKDSCRKKTSVFVVSEDSDYLIDPTYISELGRTIDEFHEECNEVDLYFLLKRLLDVFIFDVVDTVRGEEEDVVTLIYLRNKFTDLELILC